MNKKGQALVEFILILPVLLIILLSIVDIGNIFINKYELNKDLDNITALYQNNKKNEIVEYASKEKIIFEESLDSNMTVLTVKKEIEINTPILSNILGKKYKIDVSRYIYGEEND